MSECERRRGRTPRAHPSTRRLFARAAAVVVALFGMGIPSVAAAGDVPQLGAAPDLSAFAGKPIVDVRVAVEAVVWRAAPIQLRSVKLGDTFTAEAARRALLEAMASGRFAEASVHGEHVGSGVRIVVRVVPRRVVRELRLDMHGARVDRDELLGEAGLGAGAELTAETIVEKTEIMLRYLAGRGYPDARCDITTRATDTPSEVIALVDVQPGREERISSRRFFVDAREPRSFAHVTATYSVHDDDRADENALSAADAALLKRLRNENYLDATVEHRLVRERSRTELQVTLRPGKRTKMFFVGNVHYDSDALGATVSGSSDGDASTGALTARLRDFYTRRGFADASIRAEERTDDENPERHVVFHVREGRRVSVVARAYPCLREDDIRSLSGGGPRSASAIGEQIDSFLDEDLPGADLVRDADPTGLDETIASRTSLPTTHRPTPLDLAPYTVYSQATYTRAMEHVRSLYRNEGFLSAEVGPVQVVRRACAKHSPPGQCIPVEPATPIVDACAYDAQGLPQPEPPLPATATCVPDPSKGKRCEGRAALRIPVKLGPRTFVQDITFIGATAIDERTMLLTTEVAVGQPASLAKLEEAVNRLHMLYREAGFPFVRAAYALDFSPDRSRVRVRFEIAESERVLVDGIVIEGNASTDTQVILRRLPFVLGEPFRESDVKRAQERVATLGVFSSVEVGLEAPDLPQKRKRVVVKVVERLPQYVEIRPGLSTGEGIRFAAEYGHRNIGQSAIGLSGRIQASYLPDFLIFDDTVRQNFSELALSQRVAGRITTTLSLPDVGLGPLVRSTLDLIVGQDLQRGFLLRKSAVIGTLYYRPVKELQISVSQSAELNNALLLGDEQSQEDLLEQAGSDPYLNRLLRVPEGESVASAQRLQIAWDRRDNPFSAHTGTFVVVGLEHVDSYSLPFGSADGTTTFNGHFLRGTVTLAGYIPIGRRVTIAAQVRLGQVFHFFDDSRTYPDRLFFLGGADTMRGFYQDQLPPADVVAAAPTTNPGIRGGDLMVNPRVEVRIPLVGPLDSVAFVDIGNIWVDPSSIYERRIPFSMRVNVGTGIRWNTPVGVPLALDVGFNPTPLTWEPTVVPQFAVGLF